MTTTTSDATTEMGGSDLASAASGVAEEATRTAEATASRTMDRAADALDQVVQAFRGAQDELRQQQPQVAGLVDTAIERVDGAAAYLREHEPREVLDRAQSIAREQPALVIGGGLALGLMLGRVLRSATGDGAGRQGGYGMTGRYGAGYDGGYGAGYGSGSRSGGYTGAGYGTSYGADYGSGASAGSSGATRMGVGDIGGGAVGVMDTDLTRGGSGPGGDIADTDPTVDLTDETIAAGNTSDRG